MTLRLVVTAGPLRGTIVPIEGEGLFIGRDPTCQLCLPDGTLSRRHAAVLPEAGDWVLRDLGSLNGVRVNGAPVTERYLAAGDRIEIGDTTLGVAGDGDPDALGPTPLEEMPAGEPTLRLPDDEAEWGASLGGYRDTRDLATLLAASRKFAEARTEEALTTTLLAAAMAAVPAAHASLLLAEEGGALRNAGSLGRDGSVRGGRVSRTAAQMALASREALVWGGDKVDETTPESLRASGVRAAFVPLVTGGESAGVLALVREPFDLPFSVDEVQFLFGAAASAASALAGVRHVAWLEGERRRLSDLASAGDQLLGDAPAMTKARALVSKAAATDATVLLLGESGTGKELAARAIHTLGARRDAPFVAISAAALVETLVESELFGHEKGAFTGAMARRVGKLEAAHGGTLFLDEIGEMPLSSQAKLLRVLETRQFERVGGNVTVKVDVRVVAATNRDLSAEVKAGRFRSDLYYRLNGVSISLPPLRERRYVIPTLASFFLARHAERLGKRFDGFSPAALRRLTSYAWPGNVRELSNAVERAAVLSEGGLVRPEDLPETLLEAPDDAVTDDGLPPYHEAVNRAKREAVAGAMAAAGGNVTEAARQLGLHPNYLHRLLNQLGLRSG